MKKLFVALLFAFASAGSMRATSGYYSDGYYGGGPTVGFSVGVGSPYRTYCHWSDPYCRRYGYGYRRYPRYRRYHGHRGYYGGRKNHGGHRGGGRRR